jgi:two-component system, chemotaxis family, chemotaxis protein CheY
MRILIADDENTSRIILQKTLSAYGTCDVVNNGQEAVEAYGRSMETGSRYDLVCLDIMMPLLDGHQALQQIRKLEDAAGIAEADRSKVIMITSLSDAQNIMTTVRAKGNSYIVKPISVEKILKRFNDLGLAAKVK